MALQKDYTCKLGLVLNYWKITKLIHDRLAKKTVAVLSVFKDAGMSAESNECMSNTEHTNHLFDDNTVEGMTIKECYAAIKASEEDTYFSDALDV